jgi:hypothetical protein
MIGWITSGVGSDRRGSMKLYRKEFGLASADKVRELHRLRKRDDATCRMLKGH